MDAVDAGSLDLPHYVRDARAVTRGVECAVAVFASLSSRLALVQDASRHSPPSSLFPLFLSHPFFPLHHTAQILSSRRQALQLLQQLLYPSQVGTYLPLL